ncbi:MAG: hypothetical protein BWY58_01115 [Chloroflexi bacterium ADurb.Bin344]|nr:MAG: hypothetical protein BWY58_01115 [Chloroflexi bacterium ADurb.Bin344]
MSVNHRMQSPDADRAPQYQYLRPYNQIGIGIIQNQINEYRNNRSDTGRQGTADDSDLGQILNSHRDILTERLAGFFIIHENTQSDQNDAISYHIRRQYLMDNV